MTRPLDTQALREALQASPDPGGPVDVELIIERGRRLRWHRRLVVAAGGICAVLAMAGAAASVARVMSEQPGPAQHLLGPAGPRPAASRPVPDRTLPQAPSRGHVPGQRPTPVPSRVSATTAAPATPLPLTPKPSSAVATPSPTRSG